MNRHTFHQVVSERNQEEDEPNDGKDDEHARPDGELREAIVAAAPTTCAAAGCVAAFALVFAL